MKGKPFLLPAVFLLGLLCSSSAKAMSFQDFARMNDDDEATYVSQLVAGAAKILRAQGQPAEADQAISFFKDSSKSGGLNQLVMNAKSLNAQNNRNAINPNNRAPLYDVEDAMEMTLSDHGISVPVSHLRTINSDFRPSGPPRPRIIATDPLRGST